MYNSAGEFSTFVENFFRGGRLFARVVGGLRPPPPLTGLRRGLRPLLGPGKGGFVGHWQGGRRSFSPVALASAIMTHDSQVSLRLNLRFMHYIVVYCLTLLGPAAAKRQPSEAPATRSVAARRGCAAAAPRAPGNGSQRGSQMGHNVRQVVYTCTCLYLTGNARFNIFFDNRLRLKCVSIERAGQLSTYKP